MLLAARSRPAPAREGDVTPLARPRRARAIGVLNRAGAWLGRAGLGPRPIDPDAARRAAVRRTGLTDFGRPSGEEGLRVLTDALRGEARLSALGHLAMGAQVAGLLETRLRFEDWWSRHPEAAAEEIRRPFVVLGLPRTGTTLLSFLLDLDPENRSLTHWEATQPVPPPDLPTRGADPRIAAAARDIARLERVVPDIQALHPMSATMPTECVTLFALAFESLSFETLVEVPSYGRWLEGRGWEAVYDLHHRILQTLQHAIPTGRWSLKTPNHLWAPDALHAAYPDALLVWTHRDPRAVVASVSSLNTALHWGFSDEVVPAQVARNWLAKLALAVERGMDWQARQPDARVHHLDYTDLVRDPPAAVARLYAHFGLEVSPLHEARMRAFLRDQPRTQVGRHRYRLEDFGLAPEEVDERFSAYRRRFESSRADGSRATT